MSQQSKTARTLIADLPEGAGELSAEALDHVVGGFYQNPSTTGLRLGSDLIHRTLSCAASLSAPGQPDTQADVD